MHIDFLHAVIAAALILATIKVMRRMGWADAEHHRWDWRLFGGVFVVIFVFNLIWPT